MRERGLFITIHGIDGTGKTTLAQQLKDAMGESRETVLLDEVQSLIDNPIRARKSEFVGLPEQAALYASLSSKAIDGAFVEGLLESSTSVVKDRWVIDILADRSFRGALLAGDLFAGIQRPDLAVLLSCDEQVRMERILSRGDVTPQDLIPNMPGTRAAYFEDFLRRDLARSASRTLMLDTTDISVEETVQHITEEIK